MAESIQSALKTSASTHEKNISMLFDKLKELTVSTENPTDSRIFGRVEREYFALN